MVGNFSEWLFLKNAAWTYSVSSIAASTVAVLKFGAYGNISNQTAAWLLPAFVLVAAVAALGIFANWIEELKKLLKDK
jgi:hypothetical protein